MFGNGARPDANAVAARRPTRLCKLKRLFVFAAREQVEVAFEADHRCGRWVKHPESLLHLYERSGRFGCTLGLPTH